MSDKQRAGIIHYICTPQGPYPVWDNEDLDAVHLVTYDDHVAALRACEARVFAHITELLNRQKITHAELIGPQYPVLIEVSRVEAAIKEASDE